MTQHTGSSDPGPADAGPEGLGSSNPGPGDGGPGDEGPEATGSSNPGSGNLDRNGDPLPGGA